MLEYSKYILHLLRELLRIFKHSHKNQLKPHLQCLRLHNISHLLWLLKNLNIVFRMVFLQIRWWLRWLHYSQYRQSSLFQRLQALCFMHWTSLLLHSLSLKELKWLFSQCLRFSHILDRWDLDHFMQESWLQQWDCLMLHLERVFSSASIIEEHWKLTWLFKCIQCLNILLCLGIRSSYFDFIRK